MEKIECITFVCLYSKVVRRVSVNERSSLYRREHHKEAMVWQERGRQPEPQDDDEDRQTDNELHQHATLVSRLSFKPFKCLFLVVLFIGFVFFVSYVAISSTFTKRRMIELCFVACLCLSDCWWCSNIII